MTMCWLPKVVKNAEGYHPSFENFGWIMRAKYIIEIAKYQNHNKFFHLISILVFQGSVIFHCSIVQSKQVQARVNIKFSL